MINEQLLNFIEEKLKLGEKKDSIKKTLTSQGGWDSADVEEAFAALGTEEKGSSPQQIPPTTPVTQQKQPETQQPTPFQKPTSTSPPHSLPIEDAPKETSTEKPQSEPQKVTATQQFKPVPQEETPTQPQTKEMNKEKPKDISGQRFTPYPDPATTASSSQLSPETAEKEEQFAKKSPLAEQKAKLFSINGKDFNDPISEPRAQIKIPPRQTPTQTIGTKTQESPPMPQIPLQKPQTTAQSETSTSKVLGPVTLLKNSFQILKENFWLFVGISALPAIIGLGISFLQGKIAPMGGETLASISLSAVAITSILVVIAIVIGLWGYSSLLHVIVNQKEKIGFVGAYKQGAKKVGSYLWISILSSAIVLGGFVLLIVPGVILAIFFSLALIVLFAENKRGMTALLQSREYIKGRWFGVAGRLLFITAISSIVSFVPIWIIVLALTLILPKLIVSSIAGVVGIITSAIATPFGFIYLFLLYKNLKSVSGEVSVIVTKKSKIILTLFILLPLLVFIGAVFSISLMQSGEQGVGVFESAKMQTRDAKRTADMKIIELGSTLYYDDNGRFPQSVSDLVPDYIPEIPLEPQTGAQYDYISLNNGRDYEVCVDFETRERECVGTQNPLLNKADSSYTNTGLGYGFTIPAHYRLASDYMEFFNTAGVVGIKDYSPQVAEAVIVTGNNLIDEKSFIDALRGFTKGEEFFVPADIFADSSLSINIEIFPINVSIEKIELKDTFFDFRNVTIGGTISATRFTSPSADNEEVFENVYIPIEKLYTLRDGSKGQGLIIRMNKREEIYDEDAFNTILDSFIIDR